MAAAALGVDFPAAELAPSRPQVWSDVLADAPLQLAVQIRLAGVLAVTPVLPDSEALLCPYDAALVADDADALAVLIGAETGAQAVLAQVAPVTELLGAERVAVMAVAGELRRSGRVSAVAVRASLGGLSRADVRQILDCRVR